jgi:hypothetical protein
MKEEEKKAYEAPKAQVIIFETDITHGVFGSSAYTASCT